MTETNEIRNESNTNSGIVEISLKDLRVHPRNVRKSYENIDELTASIKEKGILQNLTVVPDPEVPWGYLVVIGNRRLTAALNAGLETAPCRIVPDMPESEQVMSMLTENMQRSSLTVSEEAAGIQMCLSDFGFTIEDIAQKTGLSQSTVRHRANIAKLNQQVLKKKEADDGFQLNLTDLTRLEKVGNIATRNKILKEAKDSRELAWKAQQAADDEKRAKTTKKLLALAKKEGISPAPDGAEHELYGKQWITVKEYDLSDDAPEILYDGKDKNEIVYLIHYRRFMLIRKAPKEKKVLTSYEIKERELNKRKRQIKGMYKEMLAQFRDFILNIVSGKVDELKDTKDLIASLWNILLSLDSYMSMNSVLYTLLGREPYGTAAEELDATRKTAQDMPIHKQMMAIAYKMIEAANLYDYAGCYNEDSAKKIIDFFDCLALYGFTFSEENNEYTSLLLGDNDLYTAKEEPKVSDQESPEVNETAGADDTAYDWYEDDVDQTNISDVTDIEDVNTEVNDSTEIAEISEIENINDIGADNTTEMAA